MEGQHSLVNNKSNLRVCDFPFSIYSMIKIFCVFNFRPSTPPMKIYNTEIFLNYGI